MAMWPSCAILTGDLTVIYECSWKMHIKGPGKSWKATFSVLYALWVAQRLLVKR